MENDVNGIGGFFEDLPVLILLLAGVSSVVLTSAWSVEQRAQGEELEELNRSAERILGSALAAASDDGDGEFALEDLLRLDCRAIGLEPGIDGWVVVVEVVHPFMDGAVARSSASEPTPSSVGWASTVVNATYSGDMVAVVEVTCLVW